MARPVKSGLDYYPMDADFFYDHKIRLLQARFPLAGITFYLYILGEIYRNIGYYLDFDQDSLDIAAYEVKIDRETARAILEGMLEIGLFDRELFSSLKVLTSIGVQSRFQEAKRKAGIHREVTVKPEIWLLSREETRSYIRNPAFDREEQPAEMPPKKDSGGNNPNSGGNNPDSGGNNPPKERKENKIKGKKNKGEQTGADPGSKADRPGAEPPDPRAKQLFSYLESRLPPDGNAAVQLAGLLEQGAGEELIRYGIDEASCRGKPWSYARAVIRERLVNPRPAPYPRKGYAPSYDLEELERRGLTVPKFELPPGKNSC